MKGSIVSEFSKPEHNSMTSFWSVNRLPTKSLSEELQLLAKGFKFTKIYRDGSYIT